MNLKATIFLLLLSMTELLSQDFEKETPLYVDYKQSIWVDSVLSNMSLREKIGQLYFVDAFNDEKMHNEKKVLDLIENYKVGGVIFFEGDPLKQALICNEFQSKSKIPLLISMDAEWGVSMRLKNTQVLPYQIQIAATANVENSRLISDIIAQECKRMGVHMNFAPVADINSNPKNPIIGNRSFGEDRDMVANMSISAIQAYKKHNVLACAKHFPGHGDTSNDSHKTLPLVNSDLNKLDSIELYPFRKLINSGLNSIMVAHLNVPALDRDMPSSLSHVVIDSLLKSDMGFEGLIMPDALNMRGAKAFGGPVEVNIQAFKVGHNALLYCEKVKESIVEMERQFKGGMLNVDRLDESVRKILQAKYYVGLHNYKDIDTTNLLSDLNSKHSKSVVSKVISESITVIKNENEILPIVDVEDKIAHLVYGKDDFKNFYNVARNYSSIDNFELRGDNFNSINSKLKKYSKVIISINSPYSKKLTALSRYQYEQSIKQHIAEISNSSSVIINFSNSPYRLFRYISDSRVDAIVLSYKKSDISEKYSSSSIFGSQSVSGVLPVSINEKYKVGTSIAYSSIGRLGYSTPEMEGMSSLKLNEIDTLVNNSINDSIFPGAQILVAKNGKIIYNKSFGYTSYEKQELITNDMLYDLASVTKILAATPLLMNLYESSKINLDSTLNVYLKDIDTTTKADISIRSMMAHYAKLYPWLNFYSGTLDEQGKPNKKEYYSFNLDSKHNLRVADNLFLRSDYKDSIYQQVLHSKLLDSLEYKYSDLPYYFLNQIFENKFRGTIEEESNNLLYKSLGLSKLTYKPLNKFKKEMIVPSEIDDYFRNKELRGCVNDAGAAMLGGVSSHAGLFSNAFDVAVMMQMYLQEGYYGGKRYFLPSTIEEFTSCQYCDKGNRRGLGFDKPQLEGEGPACESASYLSFGHTGFTGTMAWADPNTKLVFIFLSNRTHPSSENNKLVEENIRTQIQELVYNSIDYEK